MANNNITNVNNIRTKEIFYDLPTTAFVPTNNAITSATLDATGKSIIKIFNNGANFVFYGMAGGVHGKVVYLWVANSGVTGTYVYNNTTETCASCRLSNTVGNVNNTNVSGPYLIKLIYDSTDNTTGRWVVLETIL